MSICIDKDTATAVYKDEPLWVAGIDISLTSTGVAIVDCVSGSSYSTTVCSKGTKNDTLKQQCLRATSMAGDIIDLVERARPVRVVVESALFSSRNDTSAHRRAGLWWLITTTLISNGYEVCTLSPTELKKFATGKGNAGKDAMVAHAVDTWGLPDKVTKLNDEADALFLATAGAWSLGFKVCLNHTAYREDIADRLVKQLGS